MNFGTGAVKFVHKTWGTEQWWVNNSKYCLKTLILRPRHSCSLHYHRKKRETFIVRNGACFIEVDGKKKKLKSMDWVEIAPRTKHRFWNSSKSVYCFITEVSTHHDDKDVVRLEPSKRL